MRRLNGTGAAILAATALMGADPASAQSSVSVSGIADAAVSKGWGSVSNRNQLISGGYRTSRLIFRGTEDLGGGMSASFWLESSLGLDTGTGSPSNSNNQASGAGSGGGMTFNRRSTVSLSGRAGELRLGRDVVPQIWNVNLYEPFATNGVGASLTFTSIITGVAAVRASNTLAYLTPRNLGGFFGQVQHYLGENSPGAANSDDGTGTGLRLGYTGGNFEVAAAMGRTSYVAGDVKQDNVGGYVDFGGIRVIGHVVRDARGKLEAKGWLLGAQATFGLHAYRASYSTYETNAAGNPGAGQLAVSYAYLLSKRSSIYTTYARLRNSGGSSRALNGATTLPNASSSGLDIGIFHSF